MVCLLSVVIVGFVVVQIVIVLPFADLSKSILFTNMLGKLLVFAIYLYQYSYMMMLLHCDDRG